MSSVPPTWLDYAVRRRHKLLQGGIVHGRREALSLTWLDVAMGDPRV